jgi:sn-glycerol 3-phosphate transport system substrate-binding protein
MQKNVINLKNNNKYIRRQFIMRKNNIIATMLSAILVVLSITGCNTNNTVVANTNKETTKGASAATVTAPITLQLWHTRAAGTNGDMITSSVKKFNETNTLGITVVETFQGGYPDTLTKTMQAIAAGTQPAMVVLERAAGVPVLADQGVLADMTPYVNRDNFKMDNFLPVLLGYSYYNNQIISLPYVRSTPVFYYNKTMFEKAGYTNAPKTFAELETISKKLIETGATKKGFELLNDPAWFVQNMMYQLGSNMLSKDGKSAPCLEDGALLKVLSSWRKWVDDGWCAPFVSTDAETAMKKAFYQGELASFVASSGGLTTVLKSSTEFELGVANFPSMSDTVQAAPTGGGNIAIIDRGNNEQIKAASWEFMKFLMTDEQVAENAVNTGYLPTTYSSANAQLLKDSWTKAPQYKVAYDQLKIAQELPWSAYKADFEELLKEYCSYVIQDQTYTPEQAVKEMKENAAIIFPAK